MTRAVAAELEQTLRGGRVQQVLALDSLAVGFEIYAEHARHYLLASAASGEARLHLVSQKLRAAPPPAPTFVQLLQKYAEGAIVNRIFQPHLERIVEIEFDHHAYGVSTLVVEIMGRYSNLILLDAGRIVLDAVKRVSPDRSRVRPVQPKLPYSPPPPQNKVEPQALTAALALEGLAEMDREGGDPDAALARWLARRAAGVSPQLAREVVYRAAHTPRHRSGASPGAIRSENLVAALHALVAASPQPSLGLQDGEIVAVAPYLLTQFPEQRVMGSASEALEAFHGRLDAYNAVKEPLRRLLAEMRERLVRKRDSLKRQVVPPEEVEQYKTNGEFVLGLAYDIQPGQRELRVDLGDGAPVVIPLNPELTPLENAQEWFRLYQRAKGAADQVPARLQSAENEIEYLDQVLADLDLAETRAEIEAAQAEAVRAGFLSAPSLTRGAPALSGPREFVSREGFKILVGRNAEQNETVTFHRAEREDVWLHARGVGGAHVVVLALGREVPEATVQEAAALAAHFSQARGESQVDVAVTRRKYVRKVRGGPPGLVTIQNERTVRVAPAIPR